MKYTYKDITIGKFYDYIKLYEIPNQEVLNRRLSIVSLLTDKPMEELITMPIKELMKLGKSLSKIDLSVDLKNIKTEFIIGDQTFKSNSLKDKIKLNVKETFHIKRINEEKGTIDLLELSAILFTNSTTTFEERKVLFRDMPLEYIIPYLIFQYETTK